jgi:cholesterol oxidase
MPAEHVDVLVVGSGFGGSVAAYRFAQAGLSTVVLERGGYYPPGSFPRTPAEMNRAVWDPAGGRYGMFDVWSFRGCDSVVSSGVGGGSLVYANVLLRKDERWFVPADPLPGGGQETWPVSRADLDPHYDAVEQMLTPVPYPVGQQPYARTAKTAAMRDAARRLGLDWQLPPLAVSFAPHPGGAPGLGLPIAEAGYGNVHGLPRATCRLCGECDIGCNDGAKNTLDHTYLSAAKHHGADIRAWHEARTVRPLAGGGFAVSYVRHDPASGTRRVTSALPARTVTCDRLVLAGGSFGTLLLLLRSRSRFPGLSRALGTRFSGNGDLLTFLVGARWQHDARPLSASYGPVITSAIRVPDALDGGSAAGRGYYIEDGGYPGFVDWLVETANVPATAGRIAGVVARRALELLTRADDRGHFSDEIADLLGSGTLSAGALPLLGMGRDVPDGVVRLRNGWLDVDWNSETSREYYARMRLTMRHIAWVLGGRLVNPPLWRHKRIVTVHPVGGAPMAYRPADGVCDPYCEVFGFPGLYIADGAALPGPVGANPSLTIAALADRMCTHVLDTAARAPHRGADAALPPPGGARPASTQPASTQPTTAQPATAPEANGERPTVLSFTEEMNGFFALGETAPRAGERRGRQLGQRLSLRLTITIDDVDRFLDDPDHRARAHGWVDAGSLGGHRLGGHRRTARGWFNLFVVDGIPEHRAMRYQLHFDDGAGDPLTLLGHKEIVDDDYPQPLRDLWPDTSTLYVRVARGQLPDWMDDPADVLGAGVLYLRKRDFLQELLTVRVSGPHPARALDRFGRFFLGQLWTVYSARLRAGPLRSGWLR